MGNDYRLDPSQVYRKVLLEVIEVLGEDAEEKLITYMLLFYAHPTVFSISTHALEITENIHHRSICKISHHSYVHLFVLRTVNFPNFFVGV